MEFLCTPKDPTNISLTSSIQPNLEKLSNIHINLKNEAEKTGYNASDVLPNNSQVEQNRLDHLFAHMKDCTTVDCKYYGCIDHKLYSFHYSICPNSKDCQHCSYFAGITQYHLNKCKDKNCSLFPCLYKRRHHVQVDTNNINNYYNAHMNNMALNGTCGNLGQCTIGCFNYSPHTVTNGNTYSFNYNNITNEDQQLRTERKRKNSVQMPICQATEPVPIRWISCVKCQKPRKVPETLDITRIPHFHCAHNIWDQKFNDCKVPPEEIKSTLTIDIYGHYPEYHKEKQEFMDKLIMFFKNECPTYTLRSPTLGRKEVDLYRLFREVSSYGGNNAVVSKEGTWAKIYRGMDNFSPTETSASFRLKKIYKKYLLGFEDFFFHFYDPNRFFESNKLMKSVPRKEQMSPMYCELCEKPNYNQYSVIPQNNTPYHMNQYHQYHYNNQFACQCTHCNSHQFMQDNNNMTDHTYLQRECRQPQILIPPDSGKPIDYKRSFPLNSNIPNDNFMKCCSHMHDVNINQPCCHHLKCNSCTPNINNSNPINIHPGLYHNSQVSNSTPPRIQNPNVMTETFNNNNNNNINIKNGSNIRCDTVVNNHNNEPLTYINMPNPVNQLSDSSYYPTKVEGNGIINSSLNVNNSIPLTFPSINTENNYSNFSTTLTSTVSSNNSSLLCPSSPNMSYVNNISNFPTTNSNYNNNSLSLNNYQGRNNLFDDDIFGSEKSSPLITSANPFFSSMAGNEQSDGLPFFQSNNEIFSLDTLSGGDLMSPNQYGYQNDFF